MMTTVAAFFFRFIYGISRQLLLAFVI